VALIDGTWSLAISQGGVDLAAAGKVAESVEIRRTASGAKVARYSYQPSAGSLDTTALRNVAVTISRTQGGATHQRFSGTINRASYDPGRNLVDVECTDGLQSHARALDLAGILSALNSSTTGAVWSEPVFGRRQNGWDQLQQALSTIPYDYQLSSTGAALLTAWAAKAPAADLTLTHASGQFYDDTDELEEAGVGSLVNKVTGLAKGIGAVLHQQEISVGWACEVWDVPPVNSYDEFYLPGRSQIQQAFGQLGLRLKGGDDALAAGCLGADAGGIHFQTITGGVYDQAPWTEQATSASAVLVRRWQQPLVWESHFEVKAPDGIAADGEEVDERSASYSEPVDAQGWESSTATALPSGFVGGGGHAYQVALSESAWADMLECLLRWARTRILGTYRANYRKVQTSPQFVAAVEIGQTVRIVGEHRTSTGVVADLVERYDYDSGDAVATLTQAISRCPGSGGSDTALDAPAAPGYSAAGYSIETSITLPTHVGGQPSSPAAPACDERRGWITNATVPAPSTPVYEPANGRFAVETAEIPDLARETQKTENSAAPLVFLVYPPNEELVTEVPA
jgi:hypothetical protein